MERKFRVSASKVTRQLEEIVADVSSKAEQISAITNFDYETSESKKAFYLFSLMVLIYIVFFSPDKISQLIGSAQGDVGIFERIQDMARVIKRLVPF